MQKAEYYKTIAKDARNQRLVDFEKENQELLTDIETTIQDFAENGGYSCVYQVSPQKAYRLEEYLNSLGYHTSKFFPRVDTVELTIEW